MKINKFYPPENNSFVLRDITVGSTTIFGAAANCYVKLYGANSFPEFLNIFDTKIISSFFPALRIDNREILFFPRPYISHKWDEKNSGEENVNVKKKIKKLRWVSGAVLKDMGKSIENDKGIFCHKTDFFNSEKYISIGREFLLKKEEIPESLREKFGALNLYNKYSTERVSVPRFNADSAPFAQEEISLFSGLINGHKIQLFLYFLEDDNEANFENRRWSAALRLLTEEGIGGSRSTGKGFFENYISQNYDKNLLNGSLYILLSNLFPQKNELKSIVACDVGVDDGYITYGSALTLKKDSINFIKPGALISGKVKGRIINQKNDRLNIYRYGKAFLLPLTEVKNG